jgi:hypothetical protein
VVDGRNRVVGEPALRDSLAQVFQSYRESPAHLRVRAEGRNPNLVSWLAQQLKRSAEPVR